MAPSFPGSPAILLSAHELAELSFKPMDAGTCVRKNSVCPSVFLMVIHLANLLFENFKSQKQHLPLN